MPTLIASAKARHNWHAFSLVTSFALLGYGGAAHGHPTAHPHDAPAQSQSQQAHVHGIAQLDMAVDGAHLVLLLTAPQADITGFEHPAASAAEKQVVAQAMAQLQRPSILTPNASAACTLEEINIDGLGTDPHAEQGTSHNHSDTAAITAKDHGHHGHSHSHNDVSISWQWHCDSIQQLESIDVQLAQQFSSIRTIHVQMAMPQGQFSRTLTPKHTLLTWK